MEKVGENTAVNSVLSNFVCLGRSCSSQEAEGLRPQVLMVRDKKGILGINNIPW